MAEFIPRDLSTPFDLAAEDMLAEFEGFASDVPTSGGMINATTRSNIVRAGKLFRSGFLPAPVVGNQPLPTPDRVAPSPRATFSRQGLHGPLALAVPGSNISPPDVWSFDALINRAQPVNIGTWPASTIRVREGEIVHSTMSSRQGPHTIHHHGIEPTPVNDGVGHLTFEVVGGTYDYQWQAAESGTYFYHCHRNTVLHFEMGMYGMLIIDPNVFGAPFLDGGPGVTLVGNTPTQYDVEAIWVADDIDVRWHNEITDVKAGIQATNNDGRTGFVTLADGPRLHDFNPTVFVVSGKAAPAVDDGVNRIDAAGTTLKLNQKLLVRALNASYCVQVWKFPTSLQGKVTAVDGRTLGRSNNGFGSYSEPFSLASINHQFTLTTAQRWDLLIDGASATRFGTHVVEIEFRHWITNNLLRTVTLPIVVS